MMKKLIALILVCLMLTGCVPQDNSSDGFDFIEEEMPIFSGLDDASLLSYIENDVYSELVTKLDDENYFVQNVSAIYISKEYLEEVEYNSQENIYFGYTLSELDACFQGARYVFTLGDDGQTTVKPFESYDETYVKMLKDVAIGTGVILLCVTVSAVSAAANAPALSMIFAVSAKSGAIAGLSSGILGGISAGLVTGFETKDFGEALKAAGTAASEGFKFGAVTGAISGGISEAVALKGATLNGLTMDEAARIQKDSKLPLEFIKNFHSMDEYNVLKKSGLTLSKVNNKMALTQQIDWDFVGDLKDGRSNAQRVLDGLSPLDPTGKAYELHHIGQQSNSPLAILTHSQHKKNYSILHSNTGKLPSNIDRNLFEKERISFWKSLLEMSQGVS